jgi:homeobox protein cut-like
LYEMAALTNELDTLAITTKVKEILMAHNVGQKLFGEFVLGLSQGSVSELLSKPKSWHMLSIKGREPFIRMQLWLNDPGNMDKLLAIKNGQQQDSLKRRHPGGGLDSSSDRSSPLDTQLLDEHSNPASEPGSGAKKSRALFTEEQREALNIAFALDPYPSGSAIDYLANEINAEAKSITNWFHNHRMRLKQIHGAQVENLLATGEGGQTFEPAKFKLLLHHRKLELQASGQGGGQAQAGPPSFPFLPGFNPAMFGLHNAGGVDAGLDLSRYKGEDLDQQTDGVDQRSDCGSEKPSDQQQMSEEKNLGDSDLENRKSPENASRSRRKPAAPQWVNPEWPGDKENNGENNEMKQEPINGVCVRNIPAFKDGSNIVEDGAS